MTLLIKTAEVSLSSGITAFHGNQSTAGGQNKRKGFPEFYPHLVGSKNKEVRASRQGGVSSSKVRNRTLKSTFSKSPSGPEADHCALGNLLIIMLFLFIPVTLMLRLQ